MPKFTSELPLSNIIDSEDLFLVVRDNGQFKVKASSIRPSTPVVPTTQYVSTSGNDSTGDGSSGAPWKTINKALSLIPQLIDQNYTINVADGTYSEGISISTRTSLGVSAINFVGNSVTPANVVLSGHVTCPGTRGRNSNTSTIFVAGDAIVSFTGFKTASDATGIDVYIRQGATCTLKNFLGHTATDSGINVEDFAYLNLVDTITFDAATGTGLNYLWNSSVAIYTSGGTPTMLFQGPSTVTTYVGLRGAYNSNMLIPGPLNSNVTLNLKNVIHGIELGLQSCFNMFYFPSALNIINVTTPAGSAAVQATDQSSYETRNTTVWTHLSMGFLGNSLAYGEHDAEGGTLTQNSIGQTSSISTGAQWLAF